MAPRATTHHPSSPKLKRVLKENERSKERSIRNEVFIMEQGVDPSIEYEHEEESVHFLLFVEGRAVGCGRYRKVDSDLKLERIAVLKDHRGQGYGRLIVEGLIVAGEALHPKTVYLHSQVSAKGFYESCGFRSVGSVFREAEIDHVRMELEKEA